MQARSDHRLLGLGRRTNKSLKVRYGRERPLSYPAGNDRIVPWSLAHETIGKWVFADDAAIRPTRRYMAIVDRETESQNCHMPLRAQAYRH